MTVVRGRPIPPVTGASAPRRAAIRNHRGHPRPAAIAAFGRSRCGPTRRRPGRIRPRNARVRGAARSRPHPALRAEAAAAALEIRRRHLAVDKAVRSLADAVSAVDWQERPPAGPRRAACRVPRPARPEPWGADRRRRPQLEFGGRPARSDGRMAGAIRRASRPWRRERGAGGRGCYRADETGNRVPGGRAFLRQRNAARRRGGPAGNASHPVASQVNPAARCRRRAASATAGSAQRPGTRRRRGWRTGSSAGPGARRRRCRATGGGNPSRLRGGRPVTAAR